MENINWDSATSATPRYDWQPAENNDYYIADPSHYLGDDEEEVSIYAMAHSDDPNPEDEEKENEDDDSEEEDEEQGDWGHVDPAESNSPFPDSNDPSGPGSV